MDTTVGALKVGAQLVMGKYGVDKDNPYPIVWLKGNPNCDFIIAAWDLNSLSAHLNPVATGDKRRDQNRIYIWTADEKGTEHDLCHWRYTRKH